MTSVEGVSSNERMIFSGEPVDVVFKEEGGGFQEVKTSGEGMRKLRAEEKHLQAAVITKQERVERIKNIILSMEYFSISRNYLEVIEKIAAVDFSAAQVIVESLKDYSKGEAYLLLARSSKGEEGIEFLRKAKEGYADFSLLWKIHQEELRRDLPEAEKTLTQLHWRVQFEKGGAWLGPSTFASVRFAYQHQLADKEEYLFSLLDKIRQETPFYDFSLSGYLKEMEGWPKELIDPVLSVIRERVQECDGRNQLDLWSVFLPFEKDRPDFQRDLATVLNVIEENQEENLSYRIKNLIMKIAPFAPNEAERFLVFLDPEEDWSWVEAKVEIFVGKTRDPEFDRKGEFLKLEEEIKPYLDPYESEDYLLLFKGASAALGKEARPYFYEGIRGLKRENPIELISRGAKDYFRTLRSDWDAFWGIPNDSERFDPLQGTLFSSLGWWEFDSIMSYFPFMEREEKEMVVQAALKLYDYNPPMYRDIVLEALLEVKLDDL